MVSLLKDIYKSPALYTGLWAPGTCKNWKAVLPSLLHGGLSCIVLAAKITHLHLVFTHADLAVLSGWNSQQPSPHCARRKSSVMPPVLNIDPWQHCPFTQTVLVIFLSLIWGSHNLIALRVHPNSHFTIASHYLWDVKSSAQRVTAQQTKTCPRTWWRGWSPRSQPTYINPRQWFCVLLSFKGREKKHSQGGAARSHTNPNKQISSRKK